MKNPDGHYCTWNAQEQKFEATEYTEYANLPADKKAEVTFSTSMNGSISKIPVDYTVEIRDVLVGTQYKVEERDYEIPDGYSLQKYVLYEDKQDANPTICNVPAQGNIVSGKDPHVDVCNLKGWGLRVNKVWSDREFMTDRDPVYFAIYTGESEDKLTLVSGSVREMPYGQTTLYWFYLRLPETGVPFDQYEIREVQLTEPVVLSDGVVENYQTIVLLHNENTIELGGMQKGEISRGSFEYTVLYDKGTVQPGSNVRVDTVTNNRPGIMLKKQDWSGNALSGATFTLQDDDGNVIGTFTSDTKGDITVAFLSDHKDYVLTETKAPQGYQGLEASITIRLNNGVVFVSGDVDKNEYVLQQGEGVTPTLTIKNRPYTFEAIKIDGDTGEQLKDVTFALHKQTTVNNVTNFDVNPMEGYDKLVTDENGIIPKLDRSLPPGTYQLRETTTLVGYKALGGYIYFTVSENGYIERGTVPEGVTLDSQLENDGTRAYTLTIPNSQSKKVIVRKEDQNGSPITTGAEFALYKAEDFDDDTQRPIDEAGPLKTATTDTEGLLELGMLPVGEYRLVETKAPNGYLALTEAIHIYVQADKVEVKYIGSTGTQKIMPNGQEEYIIPVKNTQGYTLPSTGGAGTFRLTVSGLFCILLVTSIVLRRRMHR